MNGVKKKFGDTGQSLSEGLVGWSKWINSQKPARSQFATFPDVLRQLVQTLTTTNGQLNAFVDTLISAKGASGHLDVSLDRHIACWLFVQNVNSGIKTACGATITSMEGLS